MTVKNLSQHIDKQTFAVFGEPLRIGWGFNLLAPSSRTAISEDFLVPHKEIAAWLPTKIKDQYRFRVIRSIHSPDWDLMGLVSNLKSIKKHLDIFSYQYESETVCSLYVL